MKNKIKVILKMIIILIIVFLFLKIFFLNKLSNTQKNDDFLFLKLFSNGEFWFKDKSDSSEYQKVYNFKIDYKNLDFKSIDLVDTIDRKNLIYEKIAPGTRGNFDIVLSSNQNLNYKIMINSINEKPQNLKFDVSKNNDLLIKTNTLEELSEKLNGFIKKNEKINYTVHWYWNYEDDTDFSDIQDTKDAENIKRYQFNIYTLGEESL